MIRDPRPTPAGEGPIDQYLDRLLIACGTDHPRETRHLLAECEAHLRDAADDGVALGLEPHHAELAAVARFGSPETTAGSERRTHRAPLSAVVRSSVVSLFLLGCLGGIAVGVSGVVALAMRVLGGQRFLVDPPSGSALSAASCSRWLAGTPRGTSCVEAGLADWAAETIWYRVAIGVLAVLALGAFAAFRHRFSWARVPLLPSLVLSTIALVCFAAAGVWMSGLGIDALVVSSGHGAGQWLSAAPVALLAAGYFGTRVLHDLPQTST